jgi:hypothetical protein
MSGHAARVAEQYRELAAEEAALAKAAVTNEDRNKHYARASECLHLARIAEGEVIK